MKRLSVCLSVCLSGGTLACSGEPPTEEGVLQQAQVAAKEKSAPEHFVDPDGKTWILVGKIEYSSEEVKDEYQSDDDDDYLDGMEFDEVVAALRPRSDFGGYEYTLADDDAVELAELVLAELRNPTREEGPGDGRDQEVDAPADQREAKAIIGSDDRQNFNSYADSSPYRRHARMDEGGGRCTAFKMINQYTAITAAHCVHTGSAFMDRQSLRFAAPSGLKPVVGPNSNCYGRTVPSCWNGSKASCDYAIIQLRSASPFAYCTEEHYNTGWFAWRTVSDGVIGIEGRLSGYPGSPPNSWVYPTLVYDFSGDGYTQSTHNPNRVLYYNDSTGGQSGTAYYTYSDAEERYEVRAIHTGSFSNATTGFETRNYGRRIKSDLITWFDSFAGY